MTSWRGTNVSVHRAVASLAGCFLIVAFSGLAETTPGLRITFHTALTASSPGELYFWLGHALLLFPASCLLAYGLMPLLGPWIVRGWAGINALDRRELAVGLVTIVAIGVAVARLGRLAVLLDFPMTDDEYAVQYGGRIMASGHATTPLRLPEAALPSLFLYIKNGVVSVGDWPGAQAVWAMAELTRLGSLVWAVLAAVPLGALALLVGRRVGAGWGLVAAVVFLTSPMALMLSMTSHAHLASRAMLALALAGYWFAQERGTLVCWVFTGAMLGLGFLCRPLEIVFFAAPLLGWAAVQCLRRRPGYRPAVVGLVLGGIVPLVLMLAHAHAVTGDPLVPPRLSDQAPDSPDRPPRFSSEVVRNPAADTLWYRFGSNLSYNVFMLAVWFLGPLGILLCALGVMSDWFTRLLGLGVLTDLGLALFHANSGLHAVGPIHYSECAVPLTVIAVHGLANLCRAAREHGIAPRVVATGFVAAVVVGLGLFNTTHALALRAQAGIQQSVYGWIEDQVRDPRGTRAVVLAPRFDVTWLHIPALAPIGTWVHEWRRPRLDLSDEVLILHDGPEVEAPLRRQFPDRRFYRLRLWRGTPYVDLVPLPPSSPRSSR